VSDFDFDPVKGLPEVLPVNEKMLWQGSPSWKDLAIHALHVRKVGIYFLLLAVAQAVVRLWSGSPVTEALLPFLWLIPLGVLAGGILAGIAYASARTTVYTITSRRIAMRIGIALPITVNLPFKQIDGASLRLYPNGTGDIPVKLHGKEKLAYVLLWPHARPGRLARPEPALRCIPDADRVASLLAEALAASPRTEPAAASAAATPAAFTGTEITA
jgi:hypothetical protein